jgi:hypothetical protein
MERRFDDNQRGTERERPQQMTLLDGVKHPSS